jgi:hypothetical protein
LNKESPEIYLLDTNIFIEAHRRYYAMDLCPGFWDCLAHHCQKPRLLSVDRVRNEINEGDKLSRGLNRRRMSCLLRLRIKPLPNDSLK